MRVPRAGVAAAAIAVAVLARPAAQGPPPGDFGGAAIEDSGLLAPDAGAPLPRTAWGAPDLAGVWNNAGVMPLERRTAAEVERGQRALAPFLAAGGRLDTGWLEAAIVRGDRESLVVDPPDGRIPALRPAARQRLIDRENARAGRGEADSWLDAHSLTRCISRTLPVAMMPNLYNANYHILQTPDHLVVLLEMIHEARIIPLDGRPHVSGGVRQWLGDSRGRWEGDTLVVETERFHDRLDGGDHQPADVIRTGHRGPGGTLRLVERFRLADANVLDYRFTVEDPLTYTRPYTVSVPMARRDTADPLNHLFEYACHEGNRAMPNMLRAGRTDEQQAIEASARASRVRIEAGHPGVQWPAVPFVP